MSVRWEYAGLVWTYNIEKVAESDKRFARLPDANVWTEGDTRYKWAVWETYYIWRPGVAKADERAGWTTLVGVDTTNRLRILNELGAEGWELVTSQLTAHKIGPRYGWETASSTIGSRDTFKRQIREGPR